MYSVLRMTQTGQQQSYLVCAGLMDSEAHCGGAGFHELFFCTGKDRERGAVAAGVSCAQQWSWARLPTKICHGTPWCTLTYIMLCAMLLPSPLQELTQYLHLAFTTFTMQSYEELYSLHCSCPPC